MKGENLCRCCGPWRTLTSAYCFPSSLCPGCRHRSPDWAPGSQSRQCPYYSRGLCFFFLPFPRDTEGEACLEHSLVPQGEDRKPPRLPRTLNPHTLAELSSAPVRAPPSTRHHSHPRAPSGPPTQRVESDSARVLGETSVQHRAQRVGGREADHHVPDKLDPQGAGGVGLQGEHRGGYPAACGVLASLGQGSRVTRVLRWDGRRAGLARTFA